MSYGTKNAFVYMVLIIFMITMKYKSNKVLRRTKTTIKKPV